ncbi:MAG: permease-like cell division protein FtsX [Candidatus Binatia bacterium]
MKWALAGFVARRVRSSLWELLWTHVLTSGTMGMTLFVFGAFLLLQENLQHLLTGWGDQIQIQAYLKKGLAAAEIQAMLKQVRAFPEVERIRFISHEQAWTDFQAALGAQSGVLEGLPADVLPASFEIAIKPEFRDGPVVDELARRLRKQEGIAVVEYPQEWVDRLSLVILAVQWAKWLLGGVLFVATFFIVGSTVRLAILARKDEIEIMQLVGASEELIQAPFVLEGMLQGLVGAVLSVLALWGLFLFLRGQIPASVVLFGPVTQLQFLRMNSIGLILVIGWLLGGTGSLFSLRRFLRTWPG